MENDLRQNTLALAGNVYVYSAALRAAEHQALAEQLTDAAMEAVYRSVFANNAFSREMFLEHLLQGYYGAVKVNELFKMIRELGLDPEGKNGTMMLLADKIVRMYAASINTTIRKGDQPANPDINPVFPKFETPGNVDALKEPLKTKDLSAFVIDSEKEEEGGNAEDTDIAEAE